MSKHNPYSHLKFNELRKAIEKLGFHCRDLLNLKGLKFATMDSVGHSLYLNLLAHVNQICCMLRNQDMSQMLENAVLQNIPISKRSFTAGFWYNVKMD